MWSFKLYWAWALEGAIGVNAPYRMEPWTAEGATEPSERRASATGADGI
jgi:hypothetical protein